MKPLVEEIEALVARAGTHPVWGYAHCVRVYEVSRRLAEAEGFEYDEEVLRLAALLHDVGLYRAYNLREGRDHARRSAVVAARLLRDGSFPERETGIVLDAIEHHPPGTAPGGSTEAALIKDSVALDYLGAVGLSRVLAMVGLEEDVPDLPAAISHAENLRRSIPNTLLLRSSREIARGRSLEMDGFFENLKDATANLKLL